MKQSTTMKLLNFLVPSSVLMLKAFGENDENLSYTATALGFSIEAMKPFLKAAADMAADTLKDSASKVVDDIDAERTSHLTEAIINAQKSTLKAIEKEVVQELQILETGKETIYRLLLNRAGAKRETYEQMMLDFFLPLQSVLNNENNILAMLEGHQQLQPDDFVTQVVRNNLPAYAGTDRELFVADIAARFRKHYPHHFLQQLKKDNKAKTVYFTITLEALLRGGIEQKAMLSELKANVLLVIAELRSELPHLAEIGKLTDELNTTIKDHLDRLIKKLDEQSEPYLINNDFSEEGKSTDNNGLLFDYKYQYTAFVGRNAEMSKMQSFLESERSYCWWMIVGPGGMGKSRIALEIIKAAKRKGWNAGFYNQRNAHNWSHWNATEPTLIVLDYALTDIDNTIQLLSDIDNRSPRFKQKVRVLLLERIVSDNWKQALIKPGIRRSAFGSADSNWLELKELDSIWLIIEDVVNRSELSLGDKQSLLSNEKQILDDLYQIDPQRRPLFAFFAAKAMVYSEGKSIRGWNVDRLLEFHLTRLETEYWAKSEVYRKNALAFKKLLLITTLCRQVPATEMPKLEKWLLLPPRNRDVFALLTDDDGNRNNKRGFFTGLQPDILAGFYLIRTFNELANGEILGNSVYDNKVLFLRAWSTNSLGCSISIFLLIHDFWVNKVLVCEFDFLQLLEDSINNQTKEQKNQIALLFDGISSLYYKKNDINNSIKYSDKAIRIIPDLAVLHDHRGILRTRIGDSKGAMSDFSRAIRLNSEYASAYYNRGVLRATIGDHSGAVADYSEAIRFQFIDSHVFYNRGISKERLNDLRGAISDYTEAIRLQSDYHEALNNRGILWMNQGDKNAALSDFNNAIDFRPDYAPAYFNRGILRAELGDETGAISDFDKATVFKADYAPAFFHRGIIKARIGDKDGALSDYSHVIRLQPDHAMSYYQRGILKAADGNRNEAILDYSNAIYLQPEYAFTYLLRGTLRADMGEKEAALLDFNKTIQLLPDNPEAYYNRGRLKVELADYGGALEDFDTTIMLQPNNALAYSTRGSVKLITGDYFGAISDTTITINLQIDNIEAHNNRGLAKMMIKDYSDAITDFDNITKMYEAESHVYYLRGICHSQLGHNLSACADFKKALDLGMEEAREYYEQCSGH